MRRLKLFLAATAVIFCLLPAASVAAQPVDVYKDLPCQGAASSSAACNAKDNPVTGPTGVITKVTNLIAYIAGIAAILIIIIGGVMYVLSRGESNKVTAAKDTVLYAVIGLVVVILARTIIVFVVGKV